MTVTTDQVAAQLGQMSTDEFVAVVRDALKRTQAAGRRHEVAVFLRTILTEEDQVSELAGEPQNVLDVVSVMTDIALQSQARSAVLAVPMLDSQGVARAMGVQGKNLREAASELRRNGAVVGVRYGQRYLYPAFQFDLADGRPWPVVVDVNRLLGAAGDAWAVASWWVSESPRLQWRRPMDLVGTREQDDLVMLAEAA